MALGPSELLASIAASGNAPLDNGIVAARMDTPPPPEVQGMAPAGAYDAMMGYTPMENPVAQEFINAMPDAANVPNIEMHMKSAFSDPSLEQNSPAYNGPQLGLGAPS